MTTYLAPGKAGSCSGVRPEEALIMRKHQLSFDCNRDKDETVSLRSNEQ